MSTSEAEPTFQDRLEDATRALEAIRYQEPYDKRLLLERHAGLLSLAASGLETGEHDQLTAIGIKLAASHQASELAKVRGDEDTSTDMERNAGDYQTLLDMLKVPQPEELAEEAGAAEPPKPRPQRRPAKTSKAKSGGKGLR